MSNVVADNNLDYDILIAQLIDQLAQQRCVVMKNFFSASLSQALLDELHQHAQEKHLHPARIGHGEQQTLRRDIRGDDILWLDGSSDSQCVFLNIMAQLRSHINRELFLGLDELEAHFALYPPGTGYQKHLDSFQNNNLRRITIVTYLNAGWQAQNEGELLIYDESDQVIASVMPEAGTLVCFVSEEIPHAVAVTHAERASIAGWFRVRASL